MNEGKEHLLNVVIPRCLNIKETKLKAHFNLAKLADDEATIQQANLEEYRHQLETQLKQQNATERRQQGEADDMEMAGWRKRQLSGLVEKLYSIKQKLRFQEEESDRERDFKALMRQKRAAFQIRLNRLEKRQNAERNELILAQSRVQDTIARIQSIQIGLIKDPQLARRKRKENEIQTQNSRMKQQKEFEHLREIQICKVRHLTQLNDFDVNCAEELEELQAQNRTEEFELILKQLEAERGAHDELEKLRLTLERQQLIDKHKGLKTQSLRDQKKHEKMQSKAQRLAIRNREKALIAENPVILGGEAQIEEDQSENYEGSSAGTRSLAEISSLATSELTQERQQEEGSEAGDNPGGHERQESTNVQAETNANSERNKFSRLEAVTQEDKEMSSLLDAGRERIRALQLHHKKTLTDLRNHHRALISTKQRDQRRKLAELLKDHEEEIQLIKAEQVASMEELIATQKESEQIQKDNDTSEKLLGMMLPGHVLEDLEAGITPEPKSFETVTIFFTDIPQFKSLTSSVDSVALLNLLNLVYTKFDEVIQDNPALYKVECVSDTYMVAAGLSGNAKPSEDEIKEVTAVAVSCARKLLEAFKSIDLSEVGINEPLDLRVGIHTGPVLAGIVGTKMGRYCLFGDTVNTASRMCTTSNPSSIQVSPSTFEIVRDNRDFAFEERGEVNVKGKGKMTTYWLKA
ncbi:hypothetical protein HDU96_008003 [Phlyctochytrium bullatum]|nr:hypothetical protein HDU96_008003 [Phlyctochytrium bullatum]